MKLKYYKDTDSPYIDLSGNLSSQSREVSEGIVLDYADKGNLVGIDIDNATMKVALEKLVISSLPGTVETDAA